MNFEQATLRKTAVSTLPPWVGQDQDQQQPSSSGLNELAEVPLNNDNHPSIKDSRTPATLPPSSTSTSGIQQLTGSITSNKSTNSNNGNHGISAYTPDLSSGSSITQFQRSHAKIHSISGQQSQQDWSIFANMSNISTVSGLSYKPNGSFSQGGSLYASSDSMLSTSQGHGHNTMSNLRKIPMRLDIFKAKPMVHVPGEPKEDDGNPDNVCTCTCTQHRRGGSDGRLSQSPSKRRNRKETKEASRGYPTGQCVSTTPPKETTWDEKGGDTSSTQQGNTAKNTAFNIEAMKAFLNSPLFSNFLKCLTIMASVSLFAIALNSFVLVTRSSEPQTYFTNGNAALIATVALSVMTIAYSCFTIFLESRRPPEGLDSSHSKPLIVIISEIVASIVWAQVLSVTIYIYIWTYGCTEAGERQIEMIQKFSSADHVLTDRLCRRQGAMVGLELLLVLLLIFNFYTHLAQNFKFIRAVS